MKEQKSLGQASNKMMQEKAETFIRQHNSSLASIYLLDKYFVQIPQPDYTKIKEITESMTGALLDRPYIENISDYIDQLEKVTVGKSAPYFSLPNKKVRSYHVQLKSSETNIFYLISGLRGVTNHPKPIQS